MAKSKKSDGVMGGPAANAQSEKKMTPKGEMREHAKRAMRNATESWVSGHTTTKEHTAIHERAAHVLSGKKVREFKGMTGERKMKGL